MTAATLPLPRLLLTVSGWVQRPQQDVIASLVEENRGLNEPRGGRKLRLPDGQRRRLAATARLLGRRALDDRSLDCTAQMVVLRRRGCASDEDLPDVAKGAEPFKTLLRQFHRSAIPGCLRAAGPKLCSHGFDARPVARCEVRLFPGSD